jgi:ethanolamine permease
LSASAPGSPLKSSLGTLHLWGLAVGLVISGEYFGWSYGWGRAGTLGFLVTTGVVALFYVTLTLALSELGAALPSAGGTFLFAERAFGSRWGLAAGMASVVELVFAPPAIALSIGAYLSVQFGWISDFWAALLAYVVFMGLSIRGVRIAATFELWITLLAVFELLVFVAVMAPAFEWEAFSASGFSGSSELTWSALPGIVEAAPFAIWFFLGIEGTTLLAEEVRSPARSLPRALLLGIGTLLILALLVMFAAGGVGDIAGLSDRNDPLPEAMSRVVGKSSGWLHMLVWIGLFGLIASFHGIILAYSRQIFALARAGYLPRALGYVHPKRQTPHFATLAGGALGMLAIASDWVFPNPTTPLAARLVTLSVLGALTLYVLSLASLFALRVREPDLARPFLVPGYPWLPAISLLLGLGLLGVIVVSEPTLGAGFFVFLLLFAFRPGRRRAAKAA